jgi:hypothetical protein
MNVKDYIKAGQAISSDYGLVDITGAKVGAKAMIDVRVIQRGKGWSEANQRYEVYRLPVIWHPNGDRTFKRGFTNRDEYGKLDTVHINTLKPVE